MRRLSRRWRYRNTALLALSIVAIFLLADTDIARALIRQIGSYGYFGAAVTGVFFVSTFTVVPASVVLFHLSQELNPVVVALFAGAGGALGDLLIFRFLKDGVFEELRPLFYKYGGSILSTLLATPYFAWLAPVLGALVIASPFPDEIGIALMGLSRIKTWQFVGLVFILDAVGIFAIVLLARAV